MHEQGFTLLELLVAVAVVGILLTVGLPSFSAMARQNCTVTSANIMLTVLTAARSEALKRDQAVVLCRSTNGNSCSPNVALPIDAVWADGYLIYVDANNDGTRNSGEAILRTEVPLTPCASIKPTAGISISPTTGYFNRVTFSNFGKPSVGGNFTVDTKIVPKPSPNYRRRVVISPSGRPRVCDPDKTIPGGGTECGS